MLRVDDDKQKISLGLKQLSADPWSSVPRDLRGRPGAHRPRDAGRGVRRVRRAASRASRGWRTSSTFAPTGRSDGWSAQVAAGMTGDVRDPEHRSRQEADRRRARSGWLGAAPAAAAPSQSTIVPGARLIGKGRASREVRRVRVPRARAHRPHPDERDRRRQGRGRREGVSRSAPTSRSIVLEVDPAGRRIRLSVKAVQDAREAEEVREYTEREDAAPAEGFGSLADKLRGALGSRNK